MILDQLEVWKNYAALHPKFKLAFEFLSRSDLSDLDEGKYDIEGEDAYATVAHSRMRSPQEAKLEAHRKYIDIQFPLSGSEDMGWKTRSLCLKPATDYDPDRDLEFFADCSDSWITVPPEHFVIFFPDDAHAPLIGNGIIHKVIVKVAV